MASVNSIARFSHNRPFVADVELGAAVQLVVVAEAELAWCADSRAQTRLAGLILLREQPTPRKPGMHSRCWPPGGKRGQWPAQQVRQIYGQWGSGQHSNCVKCSPIPRQRPTEAVSCNAACKNKSLSICSHRPCHPNIPASEPSAA
eukprot:36223-Chlamydomonas_euryale.AAC.1